jgi:hypothetical protein
VSIEIPRVVPVYTPASATDEEALRVRRAASQERVPSVAGYARVDRRLRIERRLSPDKRPPAMDLRSGARRRTGDRLDIEA